MPTLFIKEPISADTPLYSSRIIDTYVRLLQRRYGDVNIDEVLDYAGMKAYEITDQGHWFTQKQIDRFYAVVVDAFLRYYDRTQVVNITDHAMDMSRQVRKVS